MKGTMWRYSTAAGSRRRREMYMDDAHAAEHHITATKLRLVGSYPLPSPIHHSRQSNEDMAV